MTPLPRDDAIIFGDLIGKFDVLRVACDKCDRAGRYRLHHLIKSRGRDAKVIDWLTEITADCPRQVPREEPHHAVLSHCRRVPLIAMLWRVRNSRGRREPPDRHLKRLE